MINVAVHFCEHPDCEKIPNYGFVGHKPTRCRPHALEGMISKPKRRCEGVGNIKCSNWAHWGTNGSVPERCEVHRLSTDVDMVLKRCPVCMEPKRVGQDNLCADCGSNFLSYRLCKQRRVKGYLDGTLEIPPYEYYDEIVNSSCGRERPDFVWDCGTHKVILEVDEDQHKDRLRTCEQTRMINITQAFFMPCIWIRYNPDKFKGQKATLHERDRLKTLQETLLYAFKSTPTTTNDVLRVIYLYFDQYDSSL